MVAQGIEDDAWIAAADVQDVGPDAQRVEEPDRLLEQVRERQQRHDPVLQVRHDRVEGLDRARARCRGRASRPWACPVVPEVKTSWKTSSGVGGSQAACCASQSGGKVGRRGGSGAQGVERSSWGSVARRASRGSGASRPVPRMRWRGSARADDPLDGLGRHAQVERHVDQPRPHRPEVGGRELRHRRGPGQDRGRRAPGRGPAGARRRSVLDARARGRSSRWSSRRRAEAEGGLVAVPARRPRRGRPEECGRRMSGTG